MARNDWGDEDAASSTRREAIEARVEADEDVFNERVFSSYGLALRPRRLRRRRHLSSGSSRRSRARTSPVFYLEIPPALFAGVIQRLGERRPDRRTHGW